MTPGPANAGFKSTDCQMLVIAVLYLWRKHLHSNLAIWHGGVIFVAPFLEDTDHHPPLALDVKSIHARLANQRRRDLITVTFVRYRTTSNTGLILNLNLSSAGT